jgi:hypothetical protein
MIRNKLGIFDIVCIKYFIESDIVVLEVPLFFFFLNQFIFRNTSQRLSLVVAMSHYI